jgi:ABC-type nitrate/sulfonate/bicarbonate transport system ATPase subunit
MSRAGDQDRLEVHIKRKSYRKAAGGDLQVLGGVSLAVASGEVAALIGPSGCGKTTLLRIIVGLDADFEGTVRLPAHGRLGVVFQEPRLLPWRTVEENVRLAAPLASDAVLDSLFGTLGLAAHRCHYPGELSVGLARRVALARAFAVEPELLVLDEPFVSLDAELATRLRGELAELVSRRPVTTVLVSHDVDEVIGLADRVFLLSASPARVLTEMSIQNPRSARTAAEVAVIRDELSRKAAAAQA